MGSGEGCRRLIVNADDFGISPSVNQAVVLAHREGIVTTASLMVNGAACAEAVELARQNPRLGVGLHLTLVCGGPALPPQEIPGLVRDGKEFSNDPVGTGMRYFFQRALVPQLRREMAAQIEKFHQTGLALDHVNGHLNLHLHPTVFRILTQQAAEWGIRSVRLTRDAFRLNVRLAGGRWFYRLSHTAVFHSLSRWARPQLEARQIRHTSRVFGLLQTGQVNEEYVRRLLPRLPEGDSELYSHPSMDKSKAELDALISAKVRHLVRKHSIQLIRYQDL
jgi:hopanoid biosynthesis associated protein HpnK